MPDITLCPPGAGPPERIIPIFKAFEKDKLDSPSVKLTIGNP